MGAEAPAVLEIVTPPLSTSAPEITAPVKPTVKVNVNTAIDSSKLAAAAVQEVA